MSSNKKRGAISSPSHEIEAASSHISIASIPPNFLRFPQHLSMWGNVNYGDCVIAEEAFAKACHSPEILLKPEDVVNWAKQNNFIDGTTIIDVLKAMQKSGFTKDNNTYNIGEISAVNWRDQTNLQSAIYHGPVKVGVGANQLEVVVTSNNDKNGWFAIGFCKETLTDHCVSLCGYGTISWLAQQMNVTVPSKVDGSQSGYAMFTWDSIGIIDFPSLINIISEAWLRTPTTIIVPNQVTK